jgi:steroid delta-isomerase-like uncharacterized protein
MATTTQHESENRELIRDLVTEVWNRRNYDRISELIHAEYVLHEASSPLETRGIDGFTKRTEMFHTAFPDLELRIEDLLMDGDRVVLRWTAQGTHEGNLLGIPATGATMMVPGMTIYQIEDGSVRESWEVSDMLGLREQLGLTFPSIIIQLPKLLWRKIWGS